MERHVGDEGFLEDLNEPPDDDRVPPNFMFSEWSQNYAPANWLRRLDASMTPWLELFDQRRWWFLRDVQLQGRDYWWNELLVDAATLNRHVRLPRRVNGRLTRFYEVHYVLTWTNAAGQFFTRDFQAWLVHGLPMIVWRGAGSPQTAYRPQPGMECPIFRAYTIPLGTYSEMWEEDEARHGNLAVPRDEGGGFRVGTPQTWYTNISPVIGRLFDTNARNPDARGEFTFSRRNEAILREWLQSLRHGPHPVDYELGQRFQAQWDAAVARRQ